MLAMWTTTCNCRKKGARRRQMGRDWSPSFTVADVVVCLVQITSLCQLPTNLRHFSGPVGSVNANRRRYVFLARAPQWAVPLMKFPELFGLELSWVTFLFFDTSLKKIRAVLRKWNSQHNEKFIDKAAAKTNLSFIKSSVFQTQLWSF